MFLDKILREIPLTLQKFILGTTDSELFFYFILTHLSSKMSLTRADCDIKTLTKCCRKAIIKLVEIIGPLSADPNAGPNENYLTFILTNGVTIIGHQGGKDLYFSTHKSKCSESSSCPGFSKECTTESESGHGNHLVLSSEKIIGENIWKPVPFGTFVGVDWQMKVLIQDAK